MPEINLHVANRSGCIEVITGPMFSGKTEELLRRIRRAQLANQTVVIFKPAIDTRHSTTQVVSHNQNSWPSITIEKSKEIISQSNNYNVIGIDEAQFFDSELAEVCNYLANEGKRLIAAGLDMDFKGNTFGPMPELLSIAEFVSKLSAVCVECGNPAHYSYRHSKEGPQILLGEKDKYIPLCRKCFNDFNRKP